ncbi:CUE domain-containing protein 2 isoform X2 [Bacillus rossius redtenbacheri]|uniref:CUE domain-containing protein 2 isoform X2 n=1 Tax=Bacillus rossius redtenbacheri TaxID=93214 RepID=UPI002FDDAB7D
MSIPSIADQEDIIKESLFQFVSKHSPSAQLSSIDEIVLSYVVRILEGLGSEESVEDAFDVQDFCEMLSAYFPEFSTIHHAAVCQWMFELEAMLTKKKCKDDDCNVENKSSIDIPVLPLTALSSGFPKNDCSNDILDKRVHKLSENSDGSSDGGSDFFLSHEDPFTESQINLLQEMFPGSCTVEVHHCLAIAEGDVGRAAQLVLHRQEAGQSLKSNASVLQHSLPRQKAVVDDQELKSRIIARYSYVDKDDDVREHRPVGPKSFQVPTSNFFLFYFECW